MSNERAAYLPEPDCALQKRNVPEAGLSPVRESAHVFQGMAPHELEVRLQHGKLRTLRGDQEERCLFPEELFDAAPVGYFTFDASGRVLDHNRQGASMLGHGELRLCGRPFVEFIADPAGRDIFADHLKWVMNRQSMLRCEIGLAGRDGTVIHGQLHSVAKETGAGPVILTSIVDTTVRRQLELMLRRSNEELEHRVAERNERLSLEVEERRKAEESLSLACAEIRELKDRLQAENIRLQRDMDREYNFGEIIGRSAALDYVFFRIEQVAPQDTTVLLLGETGTGKGVVARAIHSRSNRKDRPMVTVHCTSLPANLIESELFGREKGAFTGSNDRQMGRFELADGGTIFLDEIGEMPLELQTKLLRVIQDGEFERLGSPRTIKVNVRIIAATNRNLEEEISHGRFREDLFYRLNVFPVTVPPLRRRKEDIPLLVNYFVAKFCKKTGRKIETVSKEIITTLQNYHWPGNVRELESVIERAVITSPGTALHLLDNLDTGIRRPVSADAGEVKALDELERDHILQVLRKTGWRIEGERGAALILGLNPSTLRGRMRKFGIRRSYAG